jgi:hypothetical protein
MLDIPDLINHNRNGGDYDFKVNYVPEYDGAGNFNFGVESSSMGILESVAHFGAGLYHEYNGAYDPAQDGNWWNPLSNMGDSPNGYQQISNGYEWVECQCGS